jgi:hypothetical protein
MRPVLGRSVALGGFAIVVPAAAVKTKDADKKSETDLNFPRCEIKSDMK